MSNSDYNKIVSAINSASQDYTYSPPSNNLICIDTSNNRIGINTLDPLCSLHISGGDIRANNIYVNNIVSNSLRTLVSSSVNVGGSLSVDYVNSNNVNSNAINVATMLDISRGQIKAKNIIINETLDISQGSIKANTIDLSSIVLTYALDSSQGHIKTKTIDASSIVLSSLLDNSNGHIKAKTIDASAIALTSLLDNSQGHINVKTIDASSIVLTNALDISQGRIRAKTIDASAIALSYLLDNSQGHINVKTIDASSIVLTYALDISKGHIKANTIDASSITLTSLLDNSNGRINTKTIDASSINVSSLLDISKGHIKANTIDISAIAVTGVLDISKGIIHANTISGSAITINANATIDNIININVDSNVKGINITTNNVNKDAITINGIRVATIQHIEFAFPVGVIVPYNSTNIPYGWALCDGSNGRPNLINRFIYGGTNIGISGGTERVTLTIDNIASHSHTSNVANFPELVNYDTAFANKNICRENGIGGTTITTNGVAQRSNGIVTSHENMPPYCVLLYIIKVQPIDFCYNSVQLPDKPIILSTVQNANSVTITWREPSYDGGTDISGYKITNFNFGTTIQLGPLLRSYTANSLDYYTEYVFGVATVSKYGSSDNALVSIYMDT